MIKSNLEAVKRKIAEAAKRADRSVEEIKLIAVSKTFGADRILEAYNAGIMDFGENRVQEAKEKIKALGANMRWHLIGHLQTNKASVAAKLFNVIHSVDSAQLADMLDEYYIGSANNERLEVLLQVNIGGERQKGGVEPDEVIPTVKEILRLKKLNLSGLMTIPPYSEDKNVTRNYYKMLREIRDDANEKLGENVLKELSMGMSGDYDVAILEGATYIRVGTALFGERDYSDKRPLHNH